MARHAIQLGPYTTEVDIFRNEASGSAASNSTGATLAIIDEDRVAGRALEQLLRGAGYDARFLTEPALEEPGKLLADVQLIILSPTSSIVRQKALMVEIEGAPAGSRIPILRLVTARGEANGSGRSVVWPCHMADLGQEIDAAVQDGWPPEDGRMSPL